jgi:hypothetical protein
MKLADAIRIGAAIRPKTRGVMYSPGFQASCAIGAAAESVGIDIVNLSDAEIWPLVREIWPELREEHKGELRCPHFSCWLLLSASVADLIIHLNDAHGWTREAIADHLDKCRIELDNREQEACRKEEDAQTCQAEEEELLLA